MPTESIRKSILLGLINYTVKSGTIGTLGTAGTKSASAFTSAVPAVMAGGILGLTQQAPKIYATATEQAAHTTSDMYRTLQRLLNFIPSKGELSNVALHRVYLDGIKQQNDLQIALLAKYILEHQDELIKEHKKDKENN